MDSEDGVDGNGCKYTSPLFYSWTNIRRSFLIEGLVTAIIGVLSWGLMPPGPCQTKSWFRGKDGWFSEREELILVNRLLRDDPSKGDMNNRSVS